MNLLLFSTQEDFLFSMTSRFSADRHRVFSAKTVIQLHLVLMHEDINFIVMTAGIIPDSLKTIYKHMHIRCRVIPLVLIDPEKLPVSADFLTEQLSHELTAENIGILQSTIRYVAQTLNSYSPVTAFLCPDANRELPAHKGIRTQTRRLLEFFCANKGKEVSLADISNYLWGVQSAAHTKTIYSYIHELRVLLEHNPHQPERLCRSAKGMYIFK